MLEQERLNLETELMDALEKLQELNLENEQLKTFKASMNSETESFECKIQELMLEKQSLEFNLNWNLLYKFKMIMRI